jgi:hypothetical protein
MTAAHPITNPMSSHILFARFARSHDTASIYPSEQAVLVVVVVAAAHCP